MSQTLTSKGLYQDLLITLSEYYNLQVPEVSERIPYQKLETPAPIQVTKYQYGDGVIYVDRQNSIYTATTNEVTNATVLNLLGKRLS